MVELVINRDQITKNIVSLHRYSRGTESERKGHRSLVKNGKLFVCLYSANGPIFAPSRYVGYQKASLDHLTLPGRDGGVTNRRLDKLLGPHIAPGQPGYQTVDAAYCKYCDQHNITPSNHHLPRRYWMIGAPAEHTYTDSGETIDICSFSEGAERRVLVSQFERNPQARAACIKAHKPICKACDFDFASTYGEIGSGFIHVHHISPIHEVKGQRTIDPIRELVPVCPNCHAMLHTENPPMTVERLRGVIGQSRAQLPRRFS